MRPVNPDFCDWNYSIFVPQKVNKQQEKLALITHIMCYNNSTIYVYTMHILPWYFTMC